MEAGRRALDLSMRAIDAYKKTLLVDKVTTDDEKPPPVYILDEISSILMSCPLALTKEIVEYTFRRLRQPSPSVKKKVLKFIKYTVNKAGSNAYRRELQSRSITIRELVSYQGQVDPLKGNAPSQAVQDAAQEAIKAIFSSDVSIKGKKIRIEGFGNGSFSNPSTTSYRSSGYEEMERESFRRCNDSGSVDYYDSNGGFDTCDSNGSFECHNNSGSFESTNCKQERGGFKPLNCEHGKKGATQNCELSGKSQRQKLCIQSGMVASPEENLLNNVTALVGSSLRPTEESLQSFLSSAKMLNAVMISEYLKEKIQSSSWQVRLKAVCVLKAILHQKDANLLHEIEADKGEFHNFVQQCLQTQQTTLRSEAREALDMLLGLKEDKTHGKTVNGQVDDPPSCDKPFFTTEADKKVPSSAVKSQYGLVDLFSFQVEDLTCNQVPNTSPNSVMNGLLDGMCIYGMNDKAAIHVRDLLSDGQVSTKSETPFENLHHLGNAMLSPVSLQSSAVQHRQCEIDMLSFDSVFDSTANMSFSSGKPQTSSTDSKISQSVSNGNMPGLHNLDALYSHPKYAMGSLHTNTWL